MDLIVNDLLRGRTRDLGSPGADDPMDRPWTTGIFKTPASGDIFLSTTGLANDQVGDTVNHGGPEKALFPYPASHYEYWRQAAGLTEITIGGMGENLSIINATENEICIGDIYQFCSAVVQVSQPRQPCWRPARRFRVKDLALQIQQTGRTGWYFRVLQEGSVRGNSTMALLERPEPNWTIARCNDIMHHDKDNLEASAALAAVPTLSLNWKATLQKRLAGKQSHLEPRVFGPNDAEL